ncbi:MAG: hypothetical protein ACOXZ2_00895 [Sphaerochaetaceae bacterium]|jgi:hypothetical protein|nr:hypothetical protein [Sphaerochaetaceae bacterium]HHU88329.1 hypothetical protein [Spirochaetales bacterium]
MFAMMMLLIAIGTTLVCFLSAVLSIRYIFSRQGWFWIIPSFISLIFLYLSLGPLFRVAFGNIGEAYQIQLSPYRSIDGIFPLIVVVLWFLLVISLRIALRIAVPENKHLIDTKRNLAEARYVNYLELKLYRKEAHKLRRKAAKEAREVQGKTYPLEWVALYDEFN